MLRINTLTCLPIFLAAFVIVPRARAVNPAGDLGSKFEAVRQGSRALHQEFEVAHRVKSGYVEQISHLQVNVDFADGKWRQQYVGGEGERVRIFNGQDVLIFESGGTEYVRPKLKFDKDGALPEPYENRPEWGKAKELQSLPCGFSGKDHTCVIIEAPVKPWVRPGTPGEVVRMTSGTIRMMIDTQTGIWLRVHVSALVEGDIGAAQWELNYNIKSMSYGAAPDTALFKLPDRIKEVDRLTPWSDERIKKELSGKPAPDLMLVDMSGQRITLADLKGKTVLLDFWTTWCPPCQSDGPSIEKLNKKYGKNLAVVGISVDEDREIVAGYLKKHPHSYPVVLSSENSMPRPYQIGVLPTYMIIDPEGVLVTAEEGDKGFAKLRKDLQKAGLNVD